MSHYRAFVEVKDEAVLTSSKETIDLCHAAAILSQEVKKLCLCTVNLVLFTRLVVHKQIS